MKIIINKKLVDILTFGSSQSITIFPFIILRNKTDLNDIILINHEKIHIEQQKECYILPFFLIYFIEYLIKSIKYGSFDNGYMNISFEKEAYSNELNFDYLTTRKKYNFIKFFGNNGNKNKI